MTTVAVAERPVDAATLRREHARMRDLLARLADVYTVSTDQYALVRLVAEARTLEREIGGT